MVGYSEVNHMAPDPLRPADRRLAFSSLLVWSRPGVSVVWGSRIFCSAGRYTLDFHESAGGWTRAWEKVDSTNHFWKLWKVNKVPLLFKGRELRFG